MRDSQFQPDPPSFAIRKMYQHLSWPLGDFGLTDTLYPIRMLRYWFARTLLEQLHARLGRPISVLEVGIGGGQMRTFFGRSSTIERWDGLDVKVDDATRALYDGYIEADVEKPFAAHRQYDAILVLHVLEHLEAPEAALGRLLDHLVPGGALIGGSPTMPSALAAIHELRLRRKNRYTPVTEHRHLSVITPRRLRRFARAQGHGVDLLAGTFLCRWSGLVLENYSWWARLNLAWGATFPSLGGEVYFALTKN